MNSTDTKLRHSVFARRGGLVRRGELVLAAVAIAVLTILVHWPAVHNGFVYWDDPLYLVKASQLKRISLPAIEWAATALLPLYYHPLTWLSHLLDFQLWGWDPVGHHATSVLLHGLNAGLVCLFVWMLTGTVENLSSSTRLTMAAGVAVAFGIHPLQVEPVAWVAERKTVLCGFFSLLCLCAYLRAVSDPQAPRSATSLKRWWWLMVCLFLAALLSKPMAVSLPVIMLVLDFYPLRRQTRWSWWALLKEKAVLFACCVALGVVTIISQSRAGAVTNLAGFSATARCVVAARNVIFYLWKLIWPSWLSPYYPLEGEIPLGAPEFVFSAIGVIFISVLAFRLRRKVPVVWSAWCAYLALIAPVSGLMQVGGQGAGDRFMYLAMIPVLLLVAAGCVWLWRRLNLIGRGTLAPLRAGLAVLLGCLLLFYGLQARDQITVWHDDETLWTAAVGYFPNSVLANWKLAQALMMQKRYEEALPYVQKATRLNPTFGPMHATLGEVYVRTHRSHEALAELQEALRLKPDMHDARYTLACAYSRLNRLDDAYRTLQELLAVEPSYARPATADEELANLRNNPSFSARVRAMLGGVATK
ncbi:MAG: tetratricopeptide repeat protein [Verrucomicrobiia bacterium]